MPLIEYITILAEDWIILTVSMDLYSQALDLDRIKKLDLNEEQFYQLVLLVEEFGYVYLMYLGREDIERLLNRVS